MCNRLLQHFAAIAPPAALPEVPEPQPPKGHSHFATATFSPEAADGWTPQRVDDGPPRLEYEAVSFHGRYHAVHAALEWVLAFNRPRLAEHRITHERPIEWALVAFIDGTAETVGLDFARNVTPLKFFTHEIFVAPNWRPANLLDAPAADWCDEFCGLSKHEHPTLDRAARTAIKANRKFRPGLRKHGFPSKWTVVIACEADPLNRFDTIHCAGPSGTMTVVSQQRFHLVDAEWPLAPTTLAKARIGGAS